MHVSRDGCKLFNGVLAGRQYYISYAAVEKDALKTSNNQPSLRLYLYIVNSSVFRYKCSSFNELNLKLIIFTSTSSIVSTYIY